MLSHGTCRDNDEARKHGKQIGPDATHRGVRGDTADRARGIISHPERRREQPDPHREDHHHRVVHLVDADGARGRKEQRSKQYDGGNTLQHAAQHHEGDN